MDELKDFKCPNCGGRLEFNTKSQKLKCPFCEGTFEPDSFNDTDDVTVDRDIYSEDEVSVYTCNSCGGVIYTDENTAATSCPYCGNPVVLTKNVSGIYKPKRIIPFKIDKKTAKQLYAKYLEGKFLLPKQFTSNAVIEEIKGIYVPYWLFNGRAHTRMQFDATKLRYWTEGDYNYMETNTFKVFRSGRMRFENVPVDASTEVNDALTQSIEPFDIKEIKEYNDNYLAGYFADKYDVEVEESRQIVNDRISNTAESMVQSTVVGYDYVIPISRHTVLDKGTQEYVMYPVWLLNIKYEGKLYTFAINGQTGKMVGNLPINKGKATGLWLGIATAVTVISLILQYISMGG